MEAMATIQISLPLVVPEPTDLRALTEALQDLANIMLVQAEDGVWSTGSPDNERATLVAEISGQMTAQTGITI